MTQNFLLQRKNSRFHRRVTEKNVIPSHHQTTIITIDEREEKNNSPTRCISFSHSLSFSLVRENALPSSMTSSTTITFSLVTKLFKILSNGVGRFQPNAFVVISSPTPPPTVDATTPPTISSNERDNLCSK